MRLLVSLCLLLVGGPLFAEGSLECKIEHQEVTVVEDGKARVFDKFKNGAGVGDKLIFTYKYASEYIPLMVTLHDPKNNTNPFVGPYGEFQHKIKKLDGGYSVRVNASHTSGTVSEDQLYARMGGKTITLHRYYKSDYHGLFTALNNWDDNRLTHLVAALNCRTTEDGFQEFFAKFETN